MMKKNKDDITLSAVLDFDVNQEDEALMRAYAHQFDTCVHTFYNIISMVVYSLAEKIKRTKPFVKDILQVYNIKIII